MQPQIWLAIFFAGTCLLANYFPRRWGIPTAFGAMFLGLWGLGLDSLFSWQTWLFLLALSGIVGYLIYDSNQNSKFKFTERLQSFVWQPWLVVFLAVIAFIFLPKLLSNQVVTQINISTTTTKITTNP
jgi:hypothetical protein